MAKAPSSTVVSSQYRFSNDQAVVALDARAAFESLTPREKLYAHYMSKACQVGGLIALMQCSPEAPQIFRLVHRINLAESTDSLRRAALSAGVNERDFKAFLVYGSGIYTSMGNYKTFVNTKFVPDLPQEQFERIVKASAAAKNNDGFSDDLLSLWNSVKRVMYSLTERQKQLGLGKKGVTKYFSDNCDQEDADRVSRYFKTIDMEGWMNRVLKTVEDGKVTYEIRDAAVLEEVLESAVEFEGTTFIYTAGDYAPLLRLVIKSLEQAKAFAANDLERAMLDWFIECFDTGNVDCHQEGTRMFIRNKKPVIETHIGFLQTKRDPADMRAEFEGFVSVENRKTSAKFQALTDNAKQLLAHLPWPREFERDEFVAPDFNSFDVLTFSGKYFIGFQSPNYEDVRQSEGVKNMSFGNVIRDLDGGEGKGTTFLSQADHDLLDKYWAVSTEMQAGLHELLGHGSGKLLQSVNGSLNYPAGLINPLTGKPVDKHYEEGKTYVSKFAGLAAAFEECRAECVGLYLCGYEDVLKSFDVPADICSDVTYANWLRVCLDGILSLDVYDADTKEWNWTQTYSRAWFVILQVLLEAGEGFVEIKEVEGEGGQPDLLLTVDRSKIESVGKPAIGAFLQRMQVYQSTGDVEAASEMFNAYSAVRDSGRHPFAKWRDIVLAIESLTNMLVQANTILEGESVSLLSYDASHEGIARSLVDRFPAAEYREIDGFLRQLYLRDAPYFASKE